MPVSEQGVTRERYMLIPRTAIFLRRGESYLLLKGAADKKRWPGLYNAIGGHVDRGEDVLASAKRELKEETGLDAELWLCGIIMVDAGELGVGLYVFSGAVTGGSLRASGEGLAEWIPFDQIAGVPTVADVPIILSWIHAMRRGDPPFAARSYYDAQGALRLEFAESN